MAKSRKNTYTLSYRILGKSNSFQNNITLNSLYFKVFIILSLSLIGFTSNSYASWKWTSPGNNDGSWDLLQEGQSTTFTALGIDTVDGTPDQDVTNTITLVESPIDISFLDEDDGTLYFRLEDDLLAGESLTLEFAMSHDVFEPKNRIFLSDGNEMNATVYFSARDEGGLVDFYEGQVNLEDTHNNEFYERSGKGENLGTNTSPITFAGVTYQPGEVTSISADNSDELELTHKYSNKGVNEPKSGDYKFNINTFTYTIEAGEGGIDQGAIFALTFDGSVPEPSSLTFLVFALSLRILGRYRKSKK